jgi:hypothetical protein
MMIYKLFLMISNRRARAWRTGAGSAFGNGLLFEDVGGFCQQHSDNDKHHL